MRPAIKSIRPTSAAATRHLRPVLTDGLARAVRLPTGRRACTPEVAWKVILAAAAFARPVAAACAAIPAAPSGQAFPVPERGVGGREAAAIEGPPAGREGGVQAIPDGAARIAINDHRIGYYGEPNRDTTRATSSAGTHTFHTYATACVVGGPDRYTLGRTAVGAKEPMADVHSKGGEPGHAARLYQTARHYLDAGKAFDGSGILKQAANLLRPQE
ncbi:MAG TPA: hypothetical protein VH092_23535 [Urbifossiella sp.]|jgi:putative transposase|nr:hypothetical protein [Urbifossiella sp.]